MLLIRSYIHILKHAGICIVIHTQFSCKLAPRFIMSGSKDKVGVVKVTDATDTVRYNDFPPVSHFLERILK